VAGPHLDGKIIRKTPRRANESKRKARKPKSKTKNRKPNTKNNRQPNSTRSPANEVVKRGLENGMPLHLVLPPTPFSMVLQCCYYLLRAERSWLAIFMASLGKMLTTAPGTGVKL